MTDSRQIVETYLRGFYAGDSEVRRLLADDFCFSGPGAHFHGADAFLKGASHAAAGTRSLEIDKIFTTGNEIAAFYTLHLDHRVSQARIAERFRVEGGCIASSTLIMDTGPFMTRNRNGSGEMAIDPVCHMDVDTNAPAATREHNGTTYYFCSNGCAQAFSKRPEDYLAA